jgi:two-component system response regulator FixJ
VRLVDPGGVRMMVTTGQNDPAGRPATLASPPPAPVVMIVDDDAALLDSLEILVESVGHQARGYLSATDFLAAFDPQQPGCIILDERMPGMSGHKLHEELLRRGCTTPVIICTAHAEVQMAVDAMKRGALTLVQKPFRDQDLLDAIDEALRRDGRARKKSFRRRSIETLIEAITPRQREVLELMVRGRPNKVIAAELGISERTVELHRARVLHAMGVQSATELAYLVASNELEEDDET